MIQLDKFPYIQVDGINTRLSTKQHELASYLINNAGNVVSQDSIMEALYSNRVNDEEPKPKIIQVFICQLRKKGLRIQTIWGVGYRFNQEAEAA